MNTLPKELEEIIITYKNQIEHKDRFQPTLDIIKNIYYEIRKYPEITVSDRSLNGSLIEDSVEYYNRYDNLFIKKRTASRGGDFYNITVIYHEYDGVFFEKLPVQYS